MVSNIYIFRSGLVDFIDQIKQLSSRANNLKESIQTEEATKTSLIMPFFSILGYDVFNPTEFVPEFTADVGIKKGEKVDYAIMKDDQPIILIEAKWCGENLDKHGSQLFRYFGTTKAKFGILTNGLIYNFYTDLETPNKMDDKPFMTFDLLNIKDNNVAQLKRFCKTDFDLNEILTTASQLKYSNEFKKILADELQSPSDDFVRFFLSSVYDGRQTQNVIDKFKPVIKQALNNHISELMNDKIKSALNSENDSSEIELSDDALTKQKSREITTTDEELEAYFIIKNLLKNIVPIQDITYRDTVHYINILYKDNGRKWICRLYLNSSQKFLVIPDAKESSGKTRSQEKYYIDSIYDLENYGDKLSEVLKAYL